MNQAPHQTMSAGEAALWACVLEATAPKAGNVHPGAHFDDAEWLDFVASAAVCEPIFEAACERGVGATVLEGVHAAAAASGSNTNLGMVLLLSVLAAADPARPLREGVTAVLGALTPTDAEAVYEAIRFASPGGLGKADGADVSQPPTVGLVEAMALAAGRDRVAAQFASGFADVFDAVAPRLVAVYEGGAALDEAIVRVHLEQLAQHGDSLIARKLGQAASDGAARRARAVLDANMAPAALAGFDAWLRADGNRRNPGTSADLVAAGLFVVLRAGRAARPWRWGGGLCGGLGER